MKFFKNNRAITLIELITSIAISSVLFLIVFIFITDSVEELVDNNVKIDSIDAGFTFKDVMGRFVRGGYRDAQSFTGITEPSYTGAENPNHVLYLKRLDLQKGILVGIVDETGYIQRNYIYGNNYLGYRFLTVSEMSSIDSDKDKIFDIQFHQDKIFRGLRMKDFRVESYNGGNVIDMYFSVINLYDGTNIGKNFEDFFIDKLVVDEYNLIF